MICITKYQLVWDEHCKKCRVISEEESICPVCGSAKLKIIGSRKRTVLQGDGEKIILIIRRLCCQGCSRIHHELPDMLVPYKRYAVAVIEAVIDDTASTVCCENSSIVRIKRWFAESADYLVGALTAIAARFGLTVKPAGGPACRRLKDLVGEAPGWLARVVRPVVNANFWVHTRFAFLSGADAQ